MVEMKRAPRRDNDDNAFKQIFDGTSLAGWRMCGPGSFELENNMMITKGGMGLLWYTREKFRDFILRVLWKTSRKEDNSGVFVRFADPGNDPQIAVNTGYEIQIYSGEHHRGNAMHKTGAIYGFAAPSRYPATKPGEWNWFDIHAVGQNYVVILNNIRITEFTGSRRMDGYIGLQNHDTESTVCFGKVEIKEL